MRNPNLMRILIGTVLVGDSKNYAIPTYEEMCREVIATSQLKHDIDIIAAVDTLDRINIPSFTFYSPGRFWATEIVYHGKEALRKYALANGYDALVWQGIDCFYDSVDDLNKLLNRAGKYYIIGALVAGRNREDYPVCREFIGNSTKQKELIPLRLLSGQTTDVRGYIGSDATAISAGALEEVCMRGYEHWHLRRHREDQLGPEEFFMWSAIVHDGYIPLIDTSIRCWHAHETGRTVRYPGEVIDLSELHWKNGYRTNEAP